MAQRSCPRIYLISDHPLTNISYKDASDFDGHEFMSSAAAPYLDAQPDVEVGFINFRGNVRLTERNAGLAAQHHPVFNALSQNFGSRQFSAFHDLSSGHASRRIGGSISANASDDIVVALQIRSHRLLQIRHAIVKVKSRLDRCGGLDRLERFDVGRLEKETYSPRLRAALFGRLDHEVSPVEILLCLDHPHWRQ